MELGGTVCLIRSDGSPRLGMGHLMRSLALADGLRQAGAKPVFLTSTGVQDLLDKAKDAGYTVEVSPIEWSPMQDLESTIQGARRHGTTMLVTDLGNGDVIEDLDEYLGYLERLKRGGLFLVTIDDANVLPFASDIVINPNYGAETLPYQAPKGTRYLLGPRYVLFRREFLKVTGQERQIRRNADRVLMTFGGTGAADVAGKVLRALLRDGDGDNNPPEVKLGLGLESSPSPELDAVIEKFGGRCNLFGPGADLPQLMLWSDVAVTGGGLTKYETALTGTPSLVISLAEHQCQLMEGFSRAGTCTYLGPAAAVAEEQVTKEVNGLLSDHGRRVAMSTAGRNLVDGKGLERVLNAIQEAPRVSESMQVPR